MAIYSNEKKKKQSQQPVEQQAATTQAAQSPIGGGLTAQQRYDQVLAQQPQQQVNPFDQQIKDVYGQITNRGPFQYDVNGDALFQQYKDQAVGLGKTAMLDTMGQAAGLTGGYGSSYGQQAGQQAYNAYLQGLNEIVPELQQQAYGRYQDEGTALQQQYSMLQDQQASFTAEQERLYNQWLNALQIAEGDRNYAYQQEQDAQNWQWQQEQFAYQQEQDQKNWQLQQDELNYQKEQDRLSREDSANTEAYNKAYALWSAGIDNEEVRNTLGIPEDYEFATGGPSDEDDSFEKAIYSRIDENNNYVFYIGGKEYTFAPGVNPYTGGTNPDVENGTFSNGYQPNNIGGQKLSKSGITDVVNGVTQNVWKTPDGKLWIWDGTQNKYLEYEE